MRKYEFTGETKTIGKVTLHRIRALKSFVDVTQGDLGGWIEKEENLSHEGDAWVYGDAKVYGNAKVYGDARVYGDAWVFENAWVSGNAKVYGEAEVFGDAWVSGNAKVFGDAEVFGDAKVSGNAKVFGDAKVSGNAKVYGEAEVFDKAGIICISNIGSRNDTVTFMRSKESKIIVKVGCFEGTLEEFEERVRETHGENKHAQAYALAVQMARLRIKE